MAARVIRFTLIPGLSIDRWFEESGLVLEPFCGLNEVIRTDDVAPGDLCI